MPGPGMGGRRPVNPAAVRPVERMDPEATDRLHTATARGEHRTCLLGGLGEAFPSAPSPTTGQQTFRGLHKSPDGKAEGLGPQKTFKTGRARARWAA